MVEAVKTRKKTTMSSYRFRTQAGQKNFIRGLKTSRTSMKGNNAATGRWVRLI